MPDSPELVIKDATYLGKSFSGDVFSVPLDKVDAFYQAHKQDMVASGMRSFLSSMRIPGGFFKERNPVLQQDLVVDTKGGVKQKKKAEELFVLVIDGVIQFVAPHLPSSLGWEDPTTTLGLDTNVWSPIEFDVNCGVVQYVNFPDKENFLEDEYCVTSFLTLPIFYIRPIKVELGMYKLRSQNGAIDDVNVIGSIYKPDSLNSDIFGSFLGGITKANKSLSTQYVAFFEFLTDQELGTDAAKAFVKGLLEDPNCIVPPRLVKKVIQHIDLLCAGKDVPSHSPDTMDNMYDLFDTFAFYSHQGSPKLTSRNNTDRKTLRFFFEKFIESTSKGKKKEPVISLCDLLKINES